MPADVVNLANKLARITDLGSPRVVAELNDYQLKLAKFEGQFVWYAHDDTDEAFLVLAGSMRIEFRDGVVHLSEGDLCVVPKGAEHRPCADRECHVLLGSADRQRPVRRCSPTSPRSVRGGHTVQTIDVRAIAPRERHPLLFQAFEALASGQSVEKVNDHDPMPLYDQIRAERTGQLDWEYLEEGPGVWRVHIGTVGTRSW